MLIVRVIVVVQSLSPVPFFATPWTVAHQAALSVGFPRQEYWSGLPFLSPRDLPNPGIEPRSPALQAGALPSQPLGKPQRSGEKNTLIWCFPFVPENGTSEERKKRERSRPI